MNVNLIIFFVSILFFIVGLIFLKQRNHMKLLGILIIISSIGGGVKSTIFQVDEGELIVLTQFKKINRTIITPGLHFRFPWMEVYSFPKRIKSFTEKISGRSLDGLMISFDVTPFVRVNEEHLDDIYRNIAKSYDDMLAKIIIPALRNIIRSTISGFNAADIYNKREVLEKKLLKDAIVYLESRYVILEELQLRKIILPEMIEKAIQLKLEKQQQAEAIEFDKLKAQKEAEVREIEATGLANAQAIINKTLTTRYIQFQAIKNYEELAKSPNKTFIIAPTSSEGTGVPLILNSKD